MKKVILLLLFFTAYFASFSQTKTTNQVVIGSVKLDFGTPITETSISGFKLYNISTGGGTFGIGSSGTFPNWVTTGSLNTLNIPYANTTGVTGGILSNTDYLAFKNNRWSTTGNAGTVQATNFVGTTDNVGLSFRTNNIIRQTIDNIGRVGVGITTPNYDFHVNGDISMNAANQFLRSFTTGGINTKLLGITLANKLHIGGIDQPLTSILFTNNGTQMMEMLPNGNIGLGVSNPNSRLHTFGSIATPYLETNSTGYFLNDGDDAIILTNAISQTVNTPTASLTTGRLYTIVNPTTITKVFSPAVIGLDGVNTTVIGPGMSYIIKSTGTAWRIISQSVASINIPDATTTVSGKVNITSQTFAGNKTFNGNTTLGDAGTDVHTVNGTAVFNNAISQTPLALTNFTVGGAITTATTLSQYSYVTLTQTTPNISLILPIMGAGDVNKLLYVENKGSVAVILDLINYILPNKGMLFRWGGTSWISYNDNNRTPLTATATATIPLGYQNVVCQNGATPITLTLPDPSICVGHKMYFSRDPGSTGTITLTNSGTARIQALAGTVGATTTLSGFGANENWNIGLIATNTSLGYAWLRID